MQICVSPIALNALPICVIAGVLLLAGCDDGYLRGAVSPSHDGKTYFAVADDNGGHCGQIFVDGKEWRHTVNEVALISPGSHTIKCGGKITFVIPAGTIFRFDYWGP
jgi:hypothetical protein